MSKPTVRAEPIDAPYYGWRVRWIEPHFGIERGLHVATRAQAESIAFIFNMVYEGLEVVAINAEGDILASYDGPSDGILF